MSARTTRTRCWRSSPRGSTRNPTPSCVDEAEIAAWAVDNPQPYDRTAYQGLYADLHGGPEEPHTGYIQKLARDGLTKLGHHGTVSAMGVPLADLPRWDDLQILTAQLARRPLLDDAEVGTDVVIGPRAAKPLHLQIPLFVSDMSYGALSEEAKVALSRGAELAGTGICSGEGGMLPEEQAANSRYFYELASAGFGYSLEKVALCQAFHFKGGQGAKTGTGGHLPGAKVSAKIAAVRGLRARRGGHQPSHLPRPPYAPGLPARRRRGTCGDRRHPHRVQDVGPAHRG